MEFGEKLQNLRKASNLSQEQLADILGVSRQSVSKWESGVTYPEMDKLIAMAKLFKCSMDDLVNNEVKDKEIVTTKNKENEGYVDSLLNFVVDTVNMFFSMKFTTLIKTLFEIFIIGFVLFGGAIAIISIAYSFFDSFGYNGELFAFIAMLIFAAVVLGSSLFAVVSFFQIFKIRYLDYYRKAIYEEAQVRDLKLEINNPEIELNNEEDKKEFKKIKEPIVILRDPKGSSLKFLEKFVSLLRRIIEIFLIIVLLMILLPISVMLIVGLVISIYLIKVNSIFIGCILGLLGLIVVCYEIYELMYDYISKKRPAIKRLAIMFICSLVIFSIGVALSLIKVKDFKFVDAYDQISTYSLDLDFNKNLAITSEVGRTINFVINDDVKKVKIDVEYEKDLVDVSLVDRNNTKYVEFAYKEHTPYNEINKIIEGLKNNIFYNDSYRYYNKITVTTTEDNIKSIINNLADNYLIYTRKTVNGYEVEIEDIKKSIDKCNFDTQGIKRCYRVYADDACKVEVNNEGKIASQNKKCSCDFVGRDEYKCYYNRKTTNGVYE